ncbi:MAG: hypothetical protein ACI4CS_01590 [Candidatus Weimeria sp.]
MGDNLFDIKELVKELCEYDQELEWFEFKENWFEPTELGEYISAISNNISMPKSPESRQNRDEISSVIC